MKYDIQLNGHKIEIWFSLWSGKERVSYDGRVVSEKRSFMLQTIHSFEVVEMNERAVYEVVVTTHFFDFGYAVRRNGIIQAHKP
jgi:hypothetical protein